MKKLFILIMAIMPFAAFAVPASVVVTPNDATTVVVDNEEIPVELVAGISSIEDFLNLTPAKYQEITGKKMGFVKAFALKKAQKKIKKNLDSADYAGGGKTQLIAFLLCLVAGGLGVHRFYLGYIGIGVAQLLTAGGCGIWALIDLIKIIMNKLPTKDGETLEPWK